MLAGRTSLFSASGTAAARMAAASAASNGSAPIDMTAGEIWADLIDPVRQGALRAIAANASRYTEAIGMRALREAVARKVSEETGQAWSSREIAITAGAKQALFNTAMCLFDPGDQVIIPTPCWGTFAAQTKLAGATPVFVETRSNGFVPRAEDIERAITSLTRAIIVNTPNNPTGAVYDRQLLSEIAQLALEKKIWVIFDECYRSFAHDGHRHHPIVSLAPDLRERLIIVNSFSKSVALTGWRIGYLAAPEKVIGAIAALQSHTTSNPNVVAQHAVLHHLETAADGAHEAALQGRVRTSRKVGLEVLSQLQAVRPTSAAGGFYFYLDLCGLRSGKASTDAAPIADEVARSLLSDAGVATVAGTAFGDPEGLRLSYGMDPLTVQEGCRRLVSHLNAWPDQRPRSSGREDGGEWR
jgi:aspartate aminotransferase